MIKQIFLPLAGVAAFIIFVGFLTQGKIKLNKPSLAPIQNQHLIKIGSKNIKVELADTKEKRVKGLGERSFLEENSGMLFTFDQEDTYPSFWMKDMQIPVDIIWINDSKITKIDKNINVPLAGTSDKNLVLYRPDRPIDYVLEVNAGFSDKNGITIDQMISGL